MSQWPFVVGAYSVTVIAVAALLWWRTLHQGQSIGVTGSSIDNSILWPLPLTTIGLTAIFAGVALMRMRAELAEAKVEARLRRAAAE